mgnify:CR=1 FL=1
MEKKNSKRKRKSKKIFIAILMILFTGVILTASTYAWFTANKTVTVSQIDVNVTTSEGLQISTDAVNWKTIISNDDITGVTYTGVTNQLPGQTSSIKPTSTIGEIDPTTGFMKMFVGSVTTNAAGAYILTTTQSIETNSTTSGDFVVFDLYFQTNVASTIYLTANSNVQASGAATGIQNAARVGFVIQGNVAAGTATDTIRALKNDGTVKPIVWEPNFDVHTAAAVKHASDVYNITTAQAGGSKLPYVGVKAAITEGANIALNSTDATYFSAITPDIYSVEAGIPTTKYERAFDLSAGITKIRVYMWVEGQDVDCEDNASGGAIAYNLQFSTLDKA